MQFPRENPDEHYMNFALREARKAFAKGEVPIGAVAVLGDKVIAAAHNRVEKTGQACEHAELVLLRKVAVKLGNWRLHDVVIYCSLEPCAMCLGAMWLYRIQRLVYGAKDVRHGALESFLQLKNVAHPIHNVEFTGGVLADLSSNLLKQFFKERRLAHGFKTSLRTINNAAEEENIPAGPGNHS